MYSRNRTPSACAGALLSLATLVPTSTLAGSIAGDLDYGGPIESGGRPGNKALSVAGAGYVQTPLNDLSGSEITVAYWFKGSVHQSIVRQQASFGFSWVVVGWFGKHILSNDGGTDGIPAGDGITDGNWHHVAMTWKQGALDGWVAYLDGEVVATRNAINLPILDYGVDTFFGSANGGDEFAKGLIDDIAIWNRALDASEIREAMDAPLQGNETGLIGYWNFDDGTANDLTASANHGTLHGDAAIVDAADLGGGGGKIIIEATPDGSANRVLCLDGDNYVIVNSLTDLSGSEITISYWFKGERHRSVVRQQLSGYLVAGYSQNHILSNDGGTTNPLPSDGAGAATIQNGDWHHVVMTWKQNTVGGFASYLDGAPVASRDSSNFPIPNHNIATYFGSFNGVTEFMTGCVDEIAIWNRALSPTEIADGWNLRLNGDEAGLVGYWNFDDATANDSTANSHHGTFINGAATMLESIPGLGGASAIQELDAAGPYLLENATEGASYFVDAYYDRNGNGMRDDDEWRASFPESPFTVSGDLTGIDLALYDPASVSLEIGSNGSMLEIRWPEFATGTVLTTSPGLTDEPWQIVPGDFPASDGMRSHQFTPTEGSGFFRLEDR